MKITGILFLTVLLSSGPIHAQKPAADDVLVLNNVTVVDVRTGMLQPEQTVVLQHHHIASLEPSKSAKYPRNAPLVNCRGLFLIPRDAAFAIAEEAKKQEIAFEGHVPDAVRASEMSAAGMKSFEHLIGIFEGSSPAEDEFLKGNKTEGRFLATYDSARAASLAEILAKNQTWQCPTLVWERGGNLVDVSDYSKDTRVKYVPASDRKSTRLNSSHSQISYAV